MERTVSVARERLPKWLEGFASRHGDLQTSSTPTKVLIEAADGALAEIQVPFPPLAGDNLTDLCAHVARERCVAALLVRKGGHAVGIFDSKKLVASKVGHGYVQGRTKAGGWSQQRYARRRANQATKAYADAADDTAHVLLPELERLDALVCGGDRAAVDAVLADQRLAPLLALKQPQVLPVPDPRLKVLEAFADQLYAVHVGLNDLA